MFSEPQLSPFWPPMYSGPQLSLFWPPTPISASNLQWSLTVLISASDSLFGLQSAMGSKSHRFDFLHAFWSSTRSLASTPQWASRHPFSLLSLFCLSHCNSPQPSFWSPILWRASHARVGLCSVVRPLCLIWPLLCHRPPTLGPASCSAMGLPHLVRPPTLCWASILVSASRARFGFHSVFSLTRCVWPPVCCGLLLLVWPLSPWWSCPLRLASAPLWASRSVPMWQFQRQGKGHCAVAVCSAPQPRWVPR